MTGARLRSTADTGLEDSPAWTWDPKADRGDLHAALEMLSSGDDGVRAAVSRTVTGVATLAASPGLLPDQVHWPDPPQPTACDAHPIRPYVLVGLRSYC